MAASDASTASLADAVARAKALAEEASAKAGDQKEAGTSEPPVTLKGMCGWKINETCMITGLQSAAGQKLNGRHGVITAFIEASNRFQVELGPGETHAVKPENLRYSEKGPESNKRSASSASSGSESSEAKKARKRAKKRKKQRQATFSNFTSFDQSGSGYTGKTREEMTAEEKLHEMMHGPMTETERDDYVRQRTAEQKEKDATTVKTKASGALRVGDPVVIHGLQSASGQKLNGRSGVIASFVEASGRFQVRFGNNELTPALKLENLKFDSSVPEWMRD